MPTPAKIPRLGESVIEMTQRQVASYKRFARSSKITDTKLMCISCSILVGNCTFTQE